MSKKFINKCEMCCHFNGTSSRYWAGESSVICDLGVSSTLERGCGNFQPFSNGCKYDCYLRQGASFPSCGYLTSDILQGNQPCYQQAKVDWSN